MHDQPTTRQLLQTITTLVVGVGACASFWLYPPPWNQTILGLYSPKWFVGSLIANAIILAMTWSVLKRLRSRSSDDTAPQGLSVAKKITFASIMVLFFLSASEAAVRWTVNTVTPTLSSPDAGSAGKYHALLQHVDRVEVNGSFVRAYRGEVYPYHKSRATRIVCLGGSTTWGHHLEREETWPYLLESTLRDQGLDVEVINAGRHWYTTAHSIANYTTQMRYYHPDIVIIMHGINDLVRSFPAPGEPPPEWDYGSYQGPMQNVLAGYRASRRDGASQHWHPIQLLDHSAVYRLLFDESRRPRPSETADWPLAALATLDSYCEHLAYLTDLCTRDGVKVVLATQAHVYHRDHLDGIPSFETTMREVYMKSADGVMISKSSLAEAMNAVNRSTIEVADQSGIPVADVEQAVGAAPSRFMDDFHLTAAGNIVAANTIERSVLGLIANRPIPEVANADDITSARVK